MGEASCIALARSRGWIPGTDDHRAMRKEAWKHLGRDGVIDIAGILSAAIQEGLLTSHDICSIRRRLAAHSFTLPRVGSGQGGHRAEFPG